MDYDYIIIGAGSGGLTAAYFAAQLGARVALVEKYRLGGDCTWTGCVPSKALQRAARAAHAVRTAERFGVRAGPPQVDMGGVADYVQGAIDTIYAEETPEAVGAKGIDVIMGAAHFVDSHTIAVGDRHLRAGKFLITTGARPFLPPVDGLDEASFHTYETIFENRRLPARLLVLGAGPIGLELAQAYGRLGSSVTVIDVVRLPQEEPEAATVVVAVLAAEGVTFVEGLATAVAPTEAGIAVTVGEARYTGEMLLVATGRVPRVDGIGLEAAGVVYSRAGIAVNGRLETSVSHIYAAGDCTGGPQFTHYAGWQAFQATRNALLPLGSDGVRAQVPATTFTEPEVARVGMLEAEARAAHGDDVRVLRQSMAQVDRAVTEDDEAGFLKVVHLPDGTILGATIVAARAGETIMEFALALEHHLKLGQVAEALHIYPTYNTAVQLVAADFEVSRFLNGRLGRALQWLAGR